MGENEGGGVTFAEFASQHGLIIRDVQADGRVHRCATATKPRKRNGAYAFDGTKGFVQAWDVHPEAIPFHVQTPASLDRVVTRPVVDRTKETNRAAELAREIITRSVYAPHPYLRRKGLNEPGLVDPEDGRLIVPMHDAHRYGHIVSVQRIDDSGDKKFLAGGRAKEAVYHIGRGFKDILVEGYATGLSVSVALRAMYQKARVVVCFSAANLAAVARLYRGIVVADNDHSKAGEQAAVKSGLPWIMPAEIGDANDLHQKEGIDAVCRLLRST